MGMVVCRECDEQVSSEAESCPHCGCPIKRKSGMSPWLIGCLIALGAVPVVLAVVGLLAAIAIPSFVKARNQSQQNACINNLRMIDAGKEQWAMANRKVDGDAVNNQGVNQYIKGGVTPLCPGGGTYSYNAIGKNPTCSGVTISDHKLADW